MKHVPLHHRKRRLLIRLFFAAVVFLMGVLCLILSDVIYYSLPYLLSGLLFLLAVDNLYEAFKNHEFNEEDTDEIANAIIFLALAIVVLFKVGESAIIIGAIWGILGLFLAARNISHSLYELIHKQGSAAGHILHLMHAALSTGISIALLLDPAEHLHLHVYILGLELVDYAVRIAFNEV
ncbi:MAG: hypothetical protein J5496_07795 [Lachnospiraceae bacterium]|nr:hypothetical protein [Lachnospiraceae bacterium]